MASGYSLKIRTEGRVQRSRHETLNAALDELEQQLLPLVGRAQRETIDLKLRQFAPVAQIAARGEVAGPGRIAPSLRGGVDVRGDGSAEAYIGGLKRQPIEPREQESPFRALRRVMADPR